MASDESVFEPIFDDDFEPKTRERSSWLMPLLCAGGVLFIAGGGILAVIFVPAVQQARTAAKRDVAANHLKQIGLAAHNYHDTYLSFPFAAGDLGEGKNPLNFHAGILPFMEQGRLYQRIDHNKPWTDPANKGVYTTQIAGYLSPEYEVTTTADGYAATHFVPSSRFYSHERNRPLRIGDVSDGTSNTLLAGGIDAGFPAWGDPGNPRDPADGFAGGPVAFGGDGGATMLLADGSVRFVSESTSRQVAIALATPNGRELIDPKTGLVRQPARNGREATTQSEIARREVTKLKAQISEIAKESAKMRTQRDEALRRTKELEGLLATAKQASGHYQRNYERSENTVAQRNKDIERYKQELASLKADQKKETEYFNGEISRLAAERKLFAERVRTLEGAGASSPMPAGDKPPEVASKSDSAATMPPTGPNDPAKSPFEVAKINLKMLGIGAFNFNDTYGHFPPLAAGEQSDKRKPMSWHAWTLPYIDQGVLFQNIDQERVWTDPANASAYRMEVPRFLNPGIETTTDATGYAAAHFVPNSHLIEDSGRGTKIGRVTDGLSFTVMAGSIDAGFLAWGDPDNARDFANGVGGGPKAFGQDGNGALVLMSDGSVRYVSKGTAPEVIKAIATPAGNELVGKNDF